jgi:peptide/nickel transport system substrate-binding protein
MSDAINTQAEKQEVPSPSTQTVTPSAPVTNIEVNKPTNKNKNYIFYLCIVIVIIAAVAIFIFSIKGSLFKQANTGTMQNKSGYALDHVTVQMPNDELIQRYPLVQPTIVGLNVYQNTFEGLTVFRGPNVLEPGLAVSWTNPNPTTWRFTLRKGVHFQSGDLFTAKDVKYTIDACKANTTWLCNTWASQLIASVNIINDYTVDLTTTQPNATLINWLYFVGILSQAQVARDGINNAVGTGPYKIVSIASRSAELTANTNYWGETPNVKNLKYIVITDPDKAIKSLENGSTDIIFLNDDKNHGDLLSKGFYESTYNTSGLDYLDFDVNDVKSKKYVSTPNNPFHDARVRKAIYLALNVPQLITDSQIDAVPVTQFGTSDLVGYNPSIQSTQNLTEAKQLLTEAGFPTGFTVVLDTDDLPAHIKLANQLKKQLALIGIKITLEVPDNTDLYNRIGVGDYSMLLTWYYPDTLDARDFLDTLLHTPGGSHGDWNPSNISNPKLDAMLDQAESLYNTNKRIQLTQQAESFAMQDLSSIPLATENFNVFARDDVAYKASINMLILGIDLSSRQTGGSN